MTPERPSVTVWRCIDDVETAARMLGLTSARPDAPEYWGASLVGFGMALKGIAAELRIVASVMSDEDIDAIERERRDVR